MKDFCMFVRVLIQTILKDIFGSNVNWLESSLLMDRFHSIFFHYFIYL